MVAAVVAAASVVVASGCGARGGLNDDDPDAGAGADEYGGSSARTGRSRVVHASVTSHQQTNMPITTSAPRNSAIFFFSLVTPSGAFIHKSWIFRRGSIVDLPTRLNNE